MSPNTQKCRRRATSGLVWRAEAGTLDVQENMVMRALDHRYAVNSHVAYMIDALRAPDKPRPKGLSLQQTLRCQSQAAQAPQPLVGVLIRNHWPSLPG